MFSGVTDCYQPVERELELTRRCLRGLPRVHKPGQRHLQERLVERDIDLFLALTGRRGSLQRQPRFSDNATARAIEPWAPSPDRRFKLIETLAAAGSRSASCVRRSSRHHTSQLVTVLERAARPGPAGPAGPSCASPAPSSKSSRTHPRRHALARQDSSIASARPAAARSTTLASACAAAAKASTPR